MQDRTRERIALWGQFAIVCVCGSAAFIALWPYPENPKVPLLGGLLAGVLGLHATMFCYVWARYGWQAAKTLKMGG